MAINPPDHVPPPRWATVLVSAANSRNQARGSDALFSIGDLIFAWKACNGVCAVSGLPFSFVTFGDGQAKHPFAPSLDRIDRHKPYTRDNVRVVAAIANFAMNAWGDQPLSILAEAVQRKQGRQAHSIPNQMLPVDINLQNENALDADQADTDTGITRFPPRSDLQEAIVELLRSGPQSSRELETKLAAQFGVTKERRRAKLGSGCPAWRNHVAWALVDLGRHPKGEGRIECLGRARASDGGLMSIYRLRTGQNGRHSHKPMRKLPLPTPQS